MTVALLRCVPRGTQRCITQLRNHLFTVSISLCRCQQRILPKGRTPLRRRRQSRKTHQYTGCGTHSPASRCRVSDANRQERCVVDCKATVAMRGATMFRSQRHHRIRRRGAASSVMTVPITSTSTKGRLMMTLSRGSDCSRRATCRTLRPTRGTRRCSTPSSQKAAGSRRSTRRCAPRSSATCNSHTSARTHTRFVQCESFYVFGASLNLLLTIRVCSVK
jgi:hypothetical protein